ncbi:uncharacterized protein ACLA_054950 [Aspergillus clavatus NRRL 1]|uniref:C6 finger domain protein n=1 Tax=Aspergillus clavatus (strain ATCC 1007 / CBS 513.65 / DSM 816 / NCTC 3887 / NRRL 1 / QM 1276 / 107) TaxID=344612 RepID=A1C9C4_ASPCL|nr:uncharacterized protein ACLA_054950 [Aspergillus clavatus NRRL 1]EAW13448.1 conserved hypothetical protein [Aspergillus clavatus NRRL 1]
MHKECRPQSQLPPSAVFVRQTSGSVTEMSQVTPMDVDMDSRVLDYFVMFIRGNQFTPHFESIDLELLPIMQRSPHLRWAAVAIGALDASRHGSVRWHSERQSLYCIALSAYSKSINALQEVLTAGDAVRKDDVLWGIFLLGLFELISQPSGDGWAKHMLHGAAQLLQLTGPNQPVNPLRQRFWELFRGLEATRAILYGERTMLSQDSWMAFQQGLSTGRPGSWGSMENVLTLVIHTAAFSKRFFDLLGGISEPYRLPDDLVQDLGIKGLNIQTSIYEWHAEALRRLPASGEDPQFQLALAHYHALLLFLSSNYGYYPHWDTIPAPILPQTEIDRHVGAILQLAEQILDTSRIPGVMLFFPLRVAGTQALCQSQRSKILAHLNRVHQKGFLVSNQIYADLVELWEYQGLKY